MMTTEQRRKISKCRYCSHKIIKDSWTQPIENALCPSGIHKYYRCSNCGFRYLESDLSNKLLAELKEV